ncbi:MAG: phosphate signaling complex protein PhoU [Rubrivivax sp.]|nr:phosphate signaling complex protein PhoU [Rubrivivax sp.]
MSEKHLSSQFDAELSGISTRVLEMGGLVEAQVSQALYALVHFSGETAGQVLSLEGRVNTLEVEIDRELSAIIARRQPTARDLRLLIAVSKTIGNLERVGDEATRIARVVQKLLGNGVSSRLMPPATDAQFAATMANAQLRKSLDCFARLDADSAVQVIRDDHQLDREFEGQMRKLVTYMMEDPRTITAVIDLVFVAKAIERVGDHAKNIAEQVIYIVKGADVRHTAVSDIEAAVG